MRCPRCGNDLRRSKKDPNYGLCDNCRKKYKWLNDNLKPDTAENMSSKHNATHLYQKKKQKRIIKLAITVFIIISLIGTIGTIGLLSFLGKSIGSKAEHNEKNTTSVAKITEKSSESEERKNKNPLGFDVSFQSSYRNDVTGNWRLALITENIEIEKYAVDYYKNYFKADTEIHIIVNFTLNTTTRIIVMGNLLDVAIMEYVDKEEHDANIACSGMLLAEYHVNIDTGELEKIQ